MVKLIKKANKNEFMDIVKKIQSMKWEKWIHRPNGALISLCKIEGASKDYFEKIGIQNMGLRCVFYQNNIWWKNLKVFDEVAEQAEEYLKHHTIFDLSNILDKFYKKSKKRILELVEEERDLTEKLKEIREILTQCSTFLWLTHGIEHSFTKKLHSIVPKYVKGDVDKFIGDASFPKKKNVHALMEQDMRNGMLPEELVKKYGWFSPRDSFEEPFTVEDMKKQIKELKPEKKRITPEIPGQLQPLFNEVQELVWLRTARTDVIYELLYLTRPILKKAAEYYKIPWKELGKYSFESLINSKPRKINNLSCVMYESKVIIHDGELVYLSRNVQTNYVKGIATYKGKVQDIARIVHVVGEIDKVKEGDILVTQMTFPSFIPAMRKAAAFVTDEGGITCHAAILAREMKKPCVIGTKHATDIFKDGDMIEVDADKGIVRKIE